MLSYYKILQVEEDASSDEIKKQYRKLSKILHPDLNNNTKEANVIFNLLHEAYETLSDPVKKRNYKHRQQNSNASDEYNKNVSDLEGLVESGHQRERELLEEINFLREGKSQFVESEEYDILKGLGIDLEDDESEDKQYETWEILLYILLGLVALGLIILIVVIPAGWFFFIGLVVLMIYLFVTAFR